MQTLRKCPFFLQKLHVALRAGHGACRSCLPPHRKHPLYLKLKFRRIWASCGALRCLWAPCGAECLAALLLRTECVSLIFISLLLDVIAFIWVVVLSSVLARSYICLNVSLFPNAMASFRTLSEFSPKTRVSRNVSSWK